MNRLKMLLSLSLLALPLTSLAGHDSWRIGAAQHNWATYYAETAVRQARAALRLGCGYHDGRWHTHYRSHYEWALQKPRRSGEVEIDRRDRGLQACRLRYGRHGDFHRGYDHHDRHWDRDRRGHFRSQHRGRPGFSRDRDRDRRGHGRGRG